MKPRISPERRRRAVDVARGRAPADLLIANVRVVNTFTAETYPAHIAVVAGIIATVLSPNDPVPKALQVFDGGENYAVPGLIDSHLHIESSMVLPPAFAAMVVPRGVLTVIADPHEIANVIPRTCGCGSGNTGSLNCGGLKWLNNLNATFALPRG